MQPPWQQDQEYLRQTLALLESDDWNPLMGELLGFLQLLETAPSVALPTQSLSKNDHPSLEPNRPINPKRKRGRKLDTDLKEEKRIADAWQNGQYKTFEECGRALGKTKREIHLAIDNHRHRLHYKRRRHISARE